MFEWGSGYQNNLTPVWVCGDCASEMGKDLREDIIHTFHEGRCCVCERTGVIVTEPRDYGYFDQKDIIKVKRRLALLSEMAQNLDHFEDTVGYYTYTGNCDCHSHLLRLQWYKEERDCLYVEFWQSLGFTWPGIKRKLKLCWEIIKRGRILADDMLMRDPQEIALLGMAFLQASKDIQAYVGMNPDELKAYKEAKTAEFRARFLRNLEESKPYCPYCGRKAQDHKTLCNPFQTHVCEEDTSQESM